MRIANLAMALLFAAWALFQYNDPDPTLWMVVYGSAAVVCGMAFFGRLPWSLTAFLSVAYLLGAAYLLLRILGPNTFLDPTGNEMLGVQEDGREMLGLFIAAAWTGWLSLRARRHAAAPAP